MIHLEKFRHQKEKQSNKGDISEDSMLEAPLSRIRPYTLSDRSKKVLIYAIALKRSDPYISTVHLLFALGETEEVQSILNDCNVNLTLSRDIKNLRDTLRFQRFPKWAERTLMAIEAASQQTDESVMEPIDLFFGILNTPDSFGAKILNGHGIFLIKKNLSYFQKPPLQRI